MDETKGNDKPVNVIIEGQLVADAPGIADTAKNLSSRTAWTKAKVKWTVPTGSGGGYQVPESRHFGHSQ